MKLHPAFLAVGLAGVLSPLATAQLGKPIDPKKQADVNGKNVTYGDLQFDTISQPTRDLSRQSPLSKGDLKLQPAEGKGTVVDLKTLEMPTFSAPFLPKANFTAKRAVADKQHDLSQKQVEQTTQKAPITDRQIRAFTPGGEEELKKQLTEPH